MGRYKDSSETVIHEVEPGSNLDQLIRGGITAMNHFTSVLGGGLQAIALALSTPQDNSEDVQKQIDHLETQLKWDVDSLQQAINTQTKGEGNG